MLNWGIIGSGDVVNRLMGNSLNRKNKSKVLTVVSKDINQLSKLSKKIKFDNYSTNYNEIFNNKKINSVYIATTPDSHFFYIKKCVENNMNILCEKPVVISLNQLKKLKEILRHHKKKFLACYYRRYQKRFLEIKKILNKKLIGDIIYFKTMYFHRPDSHPTAPILKNQSIPWRFQKKISGGGNFLDMGTHSIDMIQFLMGEIEKINFETFKTTSYHDVEDTLITNMKLKNNIVGHGSWSSISNKNEDRFEIYGTKGKLIFSMNENSKIQLETNKNLKSFHINMEKPQHKGLADHAINLFLNKNKYIDFESLFISEIQLKPY